ncbi:hypothetical protein IAQ67_07805 [Paenibacillus peoriae]|uniref:Uncharacterized protein n=2 Tax=Paenibacillus peoriae TaxID=59893 RepID=A0A7H0YCW5_9BACL|nr:hypothetical protein IAQ67_07805 [Paenibacillus peoriae]
MEKNIVRLSITIHLTNFRLLIHYGNRRITQRITRRSKKVSDLYKHHFWILYEYIGTTKTHYIQEFGVSFE